MLVVARLEGLVLAFLAASAAVALKTHSPEAVSKICHE